MDQTAVDELNQSKLEIFPRHTTPTVLPNDSDISQWGEEGPMATVRMSRDTRLSLHPPRKGQRRPWVLAVHFGLLLPTTLANHPIAFH